MIHFNSNSARALIVIESANGFVLGKTVIYFLQ